MQDGLFQLLFIILILGASVLDAVTRSRKKRERVEEMEREEAAEEHAASADERVATARLPGPERPDPAGGKTPAGKRQEADRETADVLVPDDLWAILTGERRPTRPTPEGAGRTPPVERPMPRERPPVAGERERGGSEATERETPIHRPLPGSASRPPRGREGEVSSPRWSDRAGRKPPQRRTLPPPVAVPGEEEVYRGIEDTWTSVPDIAVGAIGEDGGGIGEDGSLPRPRGVSDSPYVALLASGRPGELRQAIVLSEILGPPKALRSGDDSPTSLRGPSS